MGPVTISFSMYRMLYCVPSCPSHLNFAALQPVDDFHHSCESLNTVVYWTSNLDQDHEAAPDLTYLCLFIAISPVGCQKRSLQCDCISIVLVRFNRENSRLWRNVSFVQAREEVTAPDFLDPGLCISVHFLIWDLVCKVVFNHLKLAGGCAHPFFLWHKAIKDQNSLCSVGARAWEALRSSREVLLSSHSVCLQYAGVHPCSLAQRMV